MPACARSPPAREAWIEISPVCPTRSTLWSPPAREAWIEIAQRRGQPASEPSPPAREAWIEIHLGLVVRQRDQGRLPRGRRGLKWEKSPRPSASGRSRLPRGRRGLKYPAHAVPILLKASPPAREAWIEILSTTFSPCPRSCRLPRGRRGLKCIRPW